MTMLRSVLAVFLGYLTFGLSAGLWFGLSGRDPHVPPSAGFATLSILWGVAFALLGGYLAATIARRRPALHGAVVALVLVVIGLASMIYQWGAGSVWSEVSVVLLMAPSALFGGALRQRQLARPAAPAAEL